jgi:beta-glucosidase
VVDRSRPRALILAIALVAGCASTTPTPSPAGSAPPSTGASSPATADWHDASLPPATRAAALLAAMTPDEKIGQMTQLEQGSVDPQGVADLLLGSVLSGGGGSPPQNDAAGWYRMVKGYQDAALGTRLGIPILYGVDAVHGHNNVVGATIFPQQVGLGAAHDADLVTRIGQATAAEMAATGIRWDFGPVVAVPQDVRWGRAYEGYGEDPAAVSSLATAFIEGLQGDDLAGQGSAAATAKHFVGDGGTAWGSSTTPGYSIDQGVVPDMDEEAFAALHLAPYRAALDAGARIVMASFSSTAAGKVHADRHLLTEVLTGDLGFTGFVVSDWAGVDQVDPDYGTSVAKAISAGIDMVMVPTDGARFQQAVKAGLDAGTITQARIDDAVSRILRVKFEMGLFEHPMPLEADDAVGSDAHRAIAREAAGKSAVLLKTAPGLLPLSATEGDVLLAGSGAEDIGLQSGGWTITWQGAPGPTTPGTTIADDLRARLADRFVYGARAIPTGTHVATGIVVVGEQPYAEGVGDSATLALPDTDLATIDAVRPLVDRLIVVILSGRPVMLDRILPTADAVVAAWLPGTEGAGIGDVLFGDRPFTGTTPYTWPLTPDDAPRTGKAACDGAVFPMGYGFDASGASLGPAACPSTR